MNIFGRIFALVPLPISKIAKLEETRKTYMSIISIIIIEMDGGPFPVLFSLLSLLKLTKYGGQLAHKIPFQVRR